MRKIVFLVFLLAILAPSFAQQNLLSLHSFYKDQLLSGKLGSTVNNGAFYPASESDYDLISAINDSSPKYYKVTHILFQKHLIEINAKDVYLTISPALNLSYGRDLGDTITRSLTQNTRGVFVEGDFFDKFSFATSFYENQAFFSRYENDYYSALGERYPKADSTYVPQNAVIPGAGRTKPFKNGGFDYAYATGYFVYAPIKQLKVIAGNNPQFIGDGHRSLLLSDNSYNAPYFRIDWKIAQKLQMTYHRSRLLNLLRRPESSSAESFYEPKGYSVNYFTYTPTDKISISLFEGSLWNRGDSIVSKFSHPLYYNPIPVVSGLILKDKNEVASLLGLNLSYQMSQKHRLYGQLAMNDFSVDKLGFQLGYRGYDFFGLNDFMLQLEYNYVPSGMYETSNPRLNYSHYNLPLAHSKGSGFNEIILRANYEFKRVYIDNRSVFFATNNHSPDAHLALYEQTPGTSGTTFYEAVEIGYRFNRKMNLCVFVDWRYRYESTRSDKPINAFSFGLKTALTNHYRDF